MESEVVERFRSEWPLQIPDHEQVLSFLTETYRRYCDEGLADKEFGNQLAEGDEGVYRQRVGELLLAEALWKGGFKLTSAAEGPDFRAEKDGEAFWIELVTPKPVGIPEVRYGEASVAPHEQTLLRWTAAIAEKSQKLLGCAQRGVKGYLEKGIVGEAERYLIAVNDRMLVRCVDEMTGVSRLPYPVEALFAVGPYGVAIDPRTLDVVGAGHQQRVFVLNRNNAEVPTNTFFDPNHAPISAVLGITLREEAILGRPHRSALVYNPLAANPLPHRLLASQEHWVCDVKPDSYTIRRLDYEPIRRDLIPRAH